MKRVEMSRFVPVQGLTRVEHSMEFNPQPALRPSALRGEESVCLGRSFAFSVGATTSLAPPRALEALRARSVSNFAQAVDSRRSASTHAPELSARHVRGPAVAHCRTLPGVC